MMALQLSERPVPNGVVLELTGDLTYAHREEFREAVEGLRQRGCRHLILDLAGVRFVDSSGLGLLALVAQHFKLAQGRVSLMRPQSYVREIMSLANITQLIPIYATEQEALAASPSAA
jgi:anti-anti-sigma factor